MQLVKYDRRRFDVCYHAEMKSTLCRTYFKCIRRDLDSTFALGLKVLANEDTLLRTHCCRHTCFPVCPRAQHLLRIQILCPGHKNVSDFVQKHFVSATNVSQFARARKRHEQQCFRNNVSSFASTFSLSIIEKVSSNYFHEGCIIFVPRSYQQTLPRNTE